MSRQQRRAQQRQAAKQIAKNNSAAPFATQPATKPPFTVPGAKFPELRAFAVNEVAKFLATLNQHLKLMGFATRQRAGEDWDDAWLKASPWGRNVAPWRLLMGIQAQLNFVMASLYAARNAPDVMDSLRFIAITYRTMREFVAAHIPVMPDEGFPHTDDRQAVLKAINQLGYAHERVTKLTSSHYGQLASFHDYAEPETALLSAFCVWFDDKLSGMRPVLSPPLTNMEGCTELIQMCGWDAFVDYLFATYWLISEDDYEASLGENGELAEVILSADGKFPIMLLSATGKLVQRHARKTGEDEQEAA